MPLYLPKRKCYVHLIFSFFLLFLGVAGPVQPDLEDKEDEVIDQEIMQLERGLYEQVIYRTLLHSQ